MITAEKVYNEILNMPIGEREKLFTTIAKRGFEKDLYSHDEVFDSIKESPFSLKETAEYLEVAIITVRRWVKEGKLQFKRVGRNIVFDIDEIRAAKQKLKNHT